MVTPDPLNSSLHVVREQADDRPQKQFCGHCGRSPDGVARKADVPSRVCPSCGMGLLLQAPAEFAPSQSDPFLVVDGSLTICALSRVAEELRNAGYEVTTGVGKLGVVAVMKNGSGPVVLVRSDLDAPA